VEKIVILVGPPLEVMACAAIRVLPAVANHHLRNERRQVDLCIKLAKDIALNNDSCHTPTQTMLLIIGRHLNHLSTCGQMHILLTGRVHCAAVRPPYIVELLEFHIRSLGISIGGLEKILNMAAYRIPRGLDELVEAIEDIDSVGHFTLVLKNGHVT
jgi:hypothetical protein